MVEPVVAQKLESLRRCIVRLEDRCPASAAELADDVDAQDIVALNLTRAVQLCIDVGLHWLSHQRDMPSPQSMGETFVILANAGQLDEQLAGRLRQAVGFRNLMVHNYEAIDWDIVFAICTEWLGDFRAFAAVFSE